MDEKEKEKNKYSFEEMSALMTMCLSQNEKNLAFIQEQNEKNSELTKQQLEKEHKEKRWLLIGWLITILAFIVYLSCYEVNITNYGDFQDSKINSSNGQQADTMTINNGKEVKLDEN